ncbi:hypothetical protein ACE1AT_27885 [Pelatocladus sp. BLCC-F211]
MIETPRLILRHFTLDDVDELAAIYKKKCRKPLRNSNTVAIFVLQTGDEG